MINYKILNENDISRNLFDGFIRHQVITKCWRKINDEWIIIDSPSIDDWSEENYEFLVKCLKNTVSTGGFVYGAFENDVLKGFVSVEPQNLGKEEIYKELSSIHVSEDMRRKGIGKTLFLAAKEWAKRNGADKLYISGQIHLLKVKHFIKKWDVLKQQFLKPVMCQENHLIVNLNAS